MPSADRVIEIARTYINTPFHHTGRVPGVGLDCSGLLVCAFRQAGCVVIDAPTYSRRPDGQIKVYLAKNARRVEPEDMNLGDILVFRPANPRRTIEQHLGLLSSIDPQKMIHAYSDSSGGGTVVEVSFEGVWKDRLIAVYRVNGVW